MWCCPVVEVGLKTKHKILIAPTKASVKCVTAYIRLWLVILWLWCVMLLIWLLLRSLVGYCCACGLLMWLCCCAIGDIHSGVKSGCKLVTLLSFLWYDKLWGPSQRVVTLFSIVNIFNNSLTAPRYGCSYCWISELFVHCNPIHPLVPILVCCFRTLLLDEIDQQSFRQLDDLCRG